MANIIDKFLNSMKLNDDEYDDEDDPHNYYNAAQMYIGAKMNPQAKLYLQMFLAKADKLKDEKEKAKLTAKVKEQLKGK